MLRLAVIIGVGLAFSPSVQAEELLVDKVCPVSYQQQELGQLVFSKAWFHASREQASYVASDNATGVGLEIHWFASESGDVEHFNVAQCQQYRILQVRTTNRRLLDGEQPSQVDAPEFFLEPFYDSHPLEHGRGSHSTPKDDRDKPWQGQVGRASTVAIYDTPYVGDALGVEGQDIEVQFETCVVCQRDQSYDSILACGSWGYSREFIGGNTGWAEPEYQGSQCSGSPSKNYLATLESQETFAYQYWLDWR